MNGKDHETNGLFPTADELRNELADTALAFRGYNITNLGRTPELLSHAVFGPKLERNLQEASEICSEFTRRKCDLVQRVRCKVETDLSSYGEAVALVLTVSMTQIQLLEQHFGVPYRRARMAFGYSLGEITALVASGMLTLREAARIPLTLSDDCVALADNATLGVMFSRGAVLPSSDVHRICVDVNRAGEGVVGISAVLAPNSVLLIGQGNTLDRVLELARDRLPERTSIRKNPHQWPPLHTPIVWQRCISERAACQLHRIQISNPAPTPPVLSLVTGKSDYDEYSLLDILHRWIDEPQLLWNGVFETLSSGIRTIIHIGPEPNIIPATYRRLSDNIESETRGSLGMRALSAVVNRPWLRAFIPDRAVLLRAPLVKHVSLENWLLAQKL